MSELVTYQLNNNVATLTLDNGKANAISPAVIEAFNAALDKAEADKAVVVITGSPGMLSGGYDLKVMTAGEDAAKALVKQGSTLARRLLSFPYPVVAACSGHAVAKGAFLLLSSDVRIGVDGPFKIGLNEVAIGMTMHNVGVELAKARLTSAAYTRSVICAEMVDPSNAVRMGFLDMAVPEDKFLATVQAVAQQLTQLDMTAHANTKLKSRAALLATLDEAIEIDATAPMQANFR